MKSGFIGFVGGACLLSVMLCRRLRLGKVPDPCACQPEARSRMSARKVDLEGRKIDIMTADLPVAVARS